jgi:hypothetical protein
VENEEEDDEGLGAAAFLITNLVRLFLSLSLLFFVFLVKGFVSKFPVYSAALERERERELSVKNLLPFIFQWEEKGRQSLFMFLVYRSFLGLSAVGSVCELDVLLRSHISTQL